MILRENKTLKTECTKTSNCCEEYARLQAENATLHEALKGAQIIAEQAKGHIAEITTLRADLEKRYAIENSKQDCINKLTNDLTRYRTAEAEGRLVELPEIFKGKEFVIVLKEWAEEHAIKYWHKEAALEAQGK